MTDSATLYAEAVKAHRTGRLADAENLYLAILAEDPGHPNALHMMGVLERGRNNGARAYAYFSKAVEAAPENAGYLNNLGVVARDLGKSEVALQAFRNALAKDPALLDARSNLGNALLAQGNFPAALAEYRHVLAADPSRSGVRNNLAIACRATGQLAEAIAIYRGLAAASPTDPAILTNLGAVLAEAGDLTEAISTYRKALALDPGYPDGLNNLGVALMEAGDSRGAEACFRKVSVSDPDAATTLGNLGTALRRQGKVAAAEAAYRESLAIRSDDGIRLRLATLLPVVASSVDEIDNYYNNVEQNIEKLIEENIRIADPLTAVGATQFHLSYHDRNNRDLNSKIARLYRQACPSLAYTAPHCGQRKVPDGRRLKVGFVSTHFHDHAVGWCYQGIMRYMPRADISVSAFSLGRSGDRLWQAIAADVDHAMVLPATLSAAREALSAAALDVIVYTDIGMDPLTYFLAFSRLAPVQCVTNGHPDTTGIPTVDYYISSAPLETSESRGHYSETLAALDDALVYYERPAPPDPLSPRRTFGLPEDATLYLCPQSLFKFHPEMDAALAAILDGDPHGRLVIFQGPEPEWSEILMRRWGHVPGMDLTRIQILERQSFSNFLNIVALSDVVLDTWPFGGGNTSYQALALDKPIVTLPGRFARGRSTMALYNRMGFPDLIAADRDGYVSLACRLGCDPEWRDEMSSRIREQSPVLFEDRGAVDAFARFLLSVGRSRR